MPGIATLGGQGWQVTEISGGSGSSGTQTRKGSGVPSDSLGADGDFYIDQDTGFWYQRSAGAYGAPFLNSKGASGSTVVSSDVIIGSGVPDSSIGSAGQAFIDAPNKLVYLPKGVASITPQGFFGVNIHIGYTSSYWPNMTVASYLALFAQMGIQTVRTNIASATKATNVLPTIKGLIASGIDVLVVIDASPNLGSTFSAQQSAASTLGASIANVLKGSGVVYIETSNEFDFNCKINNVSPTSNPRGFVADGGSYDDFTSSKFECWRGWSDGMVSGINGVTTEFKLGYASGVAFPQTAWRMLTEGRDTTGAVTKTPIPFKFLGAHFYDTQGNPTSFTCKSRTGSSVSTNTLAELRGMTGNATYDVPQTPAFELMVTEWGSRAADSNQGAFFAARALDFFNWKTTYNIKAIYAYVLFADTTDSGTGPVFGVNALNFGLIQADGATVKPAYSSFVNCIKTNTTTTPGGWPALPRCLPQPPIAYSTPVANTGNTTNNTLRTETIKGGQMGPNSSLRITHLWSYTNNANTKTVRLVVGGVTVIQSGFTATGVFQAETIIRNRGALNAQSYIGGGFSGFSTGSALATMAIDTSQDFTVAFAAQNGVGTDTITLEGYIIEVIG